MGAAVNERTAKKGAYLMMVPKQLLQGKKTGAPGVKV